MGLRNQAHLYITMTKVLFLLRGLPGSGKTSLAHHIWSHYVICEADKYFYNEGGEYIFDASKLSEAHKWCQNEVEIRMKDNQVNPQYYPEIVVSNTSTTEKELQPYIDLAKKYGYMVVSLIVENRHGNGEETNIHGVGKEVLDKMENRLKNNIKLR
jgi:hypothetical protein